MGSNNKFALEFDTTFTYLIIRQDSLNIKALDFMGKLRPVLFKGKNDKHKAKSSDIISMQRAIYLAYLLKTQKKRLCNWRWSIWQNVLLQNSAEYLGKMC